jgi:hypothetical protein
MPVINNTLSLARVGVTRLSVTPLELKCNQCGSTWMPAYDSKGHLAENWWKCPKNQSHTIDWDTFPAKPTPARRSSTTKQLKKK